MLEDVCDELDEFFEGELNITGCYEDQRAGQEAVARMTAEYKGTPMRDMVIVWMKDNTTAMAVVVMHTKEITREEVASLTQPQQPAGAQQAGAGEAGQANPPDQQQVQMTPEQRAAAAQRVPLQVYRFPDGTGSIGLVPGAMLFVSPFGASVGVIKTLVPQISTCGKQQNLGGFEIYDVVKLQDLSPQNARWPLGDRTLWRDGRDARREEEAICQLLAGRLHAVQSGWVDALVLAGPAPRRDGHAGPDYGRGNHQLVEDER